MSVLKYITIIIGSVICIMHANILAFASDTYNVSTIPEAVRQVKDDQYLIPVYLTGNEGIMGFRIYLNYESDKFNIDSITNGLVTENGTFATDIGVDDKTDFLSVLWNSTEDVKVDGSLLYMLVTVKDKESEILTIRLGYSQEDTFNEQWKDVNLNCFDITFPLDTSETKESSVVDNEQISAEIVSEVKKHINNEEENRFVEQAQVSTEIDKQIEDIGTEKIKHAIIRTLREYDAKSTSEIRESDEEEFWNKVEDNLVEYEGVKKGKLKNLDIKTIADKISFAEDEYYEDFDSGKESEDEKESNASLYLIMAIVLCLFVVIVLIVINKRRRKWNE